MSAQHIRAILALVGWGCLGMSLWTGEQRPYPPPWWLLISMSVFAFNLGAIAAIRLFPPES